MEFCTVITVKINVVEESILFVDFDRDSVFKKAKEHFKTLCNKEYSNFYKKEMDEEDMQAAIENGYWDNLDCRSCLHTKPHKPFHDLCHGTVTCHVVCKDVKCIPCKGEV